MATRDPASLFERLPELVNEDAWLVHRGRFFGGGVGVAIGETPFHLEFERGRIVELIRGPILMRSTVFRVTAAAEAWARHWERMPAPHFHDLHALFKAGHLAIEGELQPLMANLQYLKDVLATPRRLAGGARDRARARADRRPLPPPRDRRPAAPALLRGGGRGDPAVCLHTAGADGRQLRHLLNDAAITAALSRPRLRHAVARQVDCRPTAGSARSIASPRAATSSSIRRLLPRAAARAAGGHGLLDRRQASCCSSRIEHAAEFRALIGLESADHQQPWYDTSWLHRPDVHGGEVCAALVSGLIAPQSPDVARAETLWMYKQGGPGVFKGDLHFYRVDGDLRGQVGRIDTSAARSTCSPASTISPARRRTRRAPRRRSRGAEVDRDEGARPLPDEREPGPVPPLHPAGAGEDPRGAVVVARDSPPPACLCGSSTSRYFSIPPPLAGEGREGEACHTLQYCGPGLASPSCLPPQAGGKSHKARRRGDV